MDLVVCAYALTGKFPQNEQYGLVSQIRRAAVSVPANIAAGAARNGSKEFLLSRQLGYVENTEELNSKVDDVSGLVMGLASSIRRKL
jgi:hypothetical protein